MDDLDYVLNRVDPWISKFIETGANDLTPLQMIAVGTWMLEGMVNNGGFDLYYCSSAGDLALQTVDALKQIGAPQTASLLAAANAEFPGGVPPADPELRQQVLDSIQDTARFSVLETEFYQDSEGRLALLASFLRKQEERIVPPSFAR
ncbi:DMP19 family protein [Roseateles sp. L2-2]